MLEPSNSVNASLGRDAQRHVMSAKESLPHLNLKWRKQVSILALDLGTNTGWAMVDKNKLIVSGTINFSNKRYEGGGMRFLRFSNWLYEIVRISGKIDSIHFEEVRRHVGVDAAHCYGGFLATLTAWCELSKTPYAGVPVGTIKKSATGKGNANKDAMIAAMQAKGHHPADDNEADALALLHFVMGT